GCLKDRLRPVNRGSSAIKETPLNINQADGEEIQALLARIGINKAKERKSLADRIVAARPFSSLEDMRRVKGLGQSRLVSLAKYIYAAAMTAGGGEDNHPVADPAPTLIYTSHRTKGDAEAVIAVLEDKFQGLNKENILVILENVGLGLDSVREIFAIVAVVEKDVDFTRLFDAMLRKFPEHLTQSFLSSPQGDIVERFLRDNHNDLAVRALENIFENEIRKRNAHEAIRENNHKHKEDPERNGAEQERNMLVLFREEYAKCFDDFLLGSGVNIFDETGGKLDIYSIEGLSFNTWVGCLLAFYAEGKARDAFCAFQIDEYLKLKRKAIEIFVKFSYFDRDKEFIELLEKTQKRFPRMHIFAVRGWMHHYMLPGIMLERDRESLPMHNEICLEKLKGRYPAAGLSEDLLLKQSYIQEVLDDVLTVAFSGDYTSSGKLSKKIAARLSDTDVNAISKELSKRKNYDVKEVVYFWLKTNGRVTPQEEELFLEYQIVLYLIMADSLKRKIGFADVSSELFTIMLFLAAFIDTLYEVNKDKFLSCVKEHDLGRLFKDEFWVFPVLKGLPEKEKIEKIISLVYPGLPGHVMPEALRQATQAWNKIKDKSKNDPLIKHVIASSSCQERMTEAGHLINNRSEAENQRVAEQRAANPEHQTASTHKITGVSTSGSLTQNQVALNGMKSSPIVARICSSS
ncbi:MAG: helix-hairpin-helix domain-containing protein, partial [Candidatus Omnitrophota bacterium]